MKAPSWTTVSSKRKADTKKKATSVEPAHVDVVAVARVMGCEDGWSDLAWPASACEEFADAACLGDEDLSDFIASLLRGEHVAPRDFLGKREKSRAPALADAMRDGSAKIVVRPGSLVLETQCRDMSLAQSVVVEERKRRVTDLIAALSIKYLAASSGSRIVKGGEGGVLATAPLVVRKEREQRDVDASLGTAFFQFWQLKDSGGHSIAALKSVCELLGELYCLSLTHIARPTTKVFVLFIEKNEQVLVENLDIFHSRQSETDPPNWKEFVAEQAEKQCGILTTSKGCITTKSHSFVLMSNTEACIHAFAKETEVQLQQFNVSVGKAVSVDVADPRAAALGIDFANVRAKIVQMPARFILDSPEDDFVFCFKQGQWGHARRFHKLVNEKRMNTTEVVNPGNCRFLCEKPVANAVDGLLHLGGIVVPKGMAEMMEDRIALCDIDKKTRRATTHFAMPGQWFSGADLPELKEFVHSLPYVNKVDLSGNDFGGAEFITWITSGLVERRKVMVNVCGTKVFAGPKCFKWLLDVKASLLEGLVWLSEEEYDALEWQKLMFTDAQTRAVVKAHSLWYQK
jgi:hypothetical protein